MDFNEKIEKNIAGVIGSLNNIIPTKLNEETGLVEVSIPTTKIKLEVGVHHIVVHHHDYIPVERQLYHVSDVKMLVADMVTYMMMGIAHYCHDEYRQFVKMADGGGFVKLYCLGLGELELVCNRGSGFKILCGRGFEAMGNSDYRPGTVISQENVHKLLESIINANIVPPIGKFLSEPATKWLREQDYNNRTYQQREALVAAAEALYPTA